MSKQANRATVLIVDDDEAFQADILRYVSSHNVLAAYSEFGALDSLHKESVDVAVLDVNLGQRSNGFDLLCSIRAEFPAIGVLMLTAFDTVPDAVRAIQGGAATYLAKTTENYECLSDHIEAIVRMQRQRQELLASGWLDDLKYSVDQLARLARSGHSQSSPQEMAVLGEQFSEAIRNARPLSFADRLNFNEVVGRFGTALLRLATSRYGTKREAARHLMLHYSTLKRRLATDPNPTLPSNRRRSTS